MAKAAKVESLFHPKSKELGLSQAVLSVNPVGFSLKYPWMSPQVGKLVDDSLHPITHWMSLPEPPKDNQ